MNEHKHEWQIALNEVYCACQQTMTYADAERRINEYEVLKAEIERLRDALNAHAVELIPVPSLDPASATRMVCFECGAEWLPDEPQAHNVGCIAALQGGDDE